MSIDDKIGEELNKHDKFMSDCVSKNKCFDYLKFLSDTYNFTYDSVVNYNLDVFNYYLKENVNETQSKFMGLYSTHKFILELKYGGD